jgi:hypothetical protein
MAAHKNQHFVPKVHLRPFSTDADQNAISLFNVKSGQAIHTAPIKHQCAKNYFYGKDGVLESLFVEIEGKYAEGVRSHLIPSRANDLPADTAGARTSSDPSKSAGKGRSRRRTALAPLEQRHEPMLVCQVLAYRPPKPEGREIPLHLPPAHLWKGRDRPSTSRTSKLRGLQDNLVVLEEASTRRKASF